MHALEARVFLLRATGGGPAPAVEYFVGAHGPVEAATCLRNGEAPAPVWREIQTVAVDKQVAHDLTSIEVGYRLLIPEDPEWPHRALRVLTERGLGAPLGLWVSGGGDLAAAGGSTVTVTGTRAATSYGLHVARGFGQDLAGTHTVITGGRDGIDGAACQAAVLGGGAKPPWVVLPCGLDAMLPDDQASLLEAVADKGGCVLSEYPPGTAPTRARLAASGRLLAALGGCTVVVEAGTRSLAVPLARTAAALGRAVWGVPGPITSVAHQGVHALLRNGTAATVTTAEDITARARCPWP